MFFVNLLSILVIYVFSLFNKMFIEDVFGVKNYKIYKEVYDKKYWYI